MRRGGTAGVLGAAGALAEATSPRLTVVVPAHRCAATLRLALAALARSDLPRDRWELVVVDDASDDDTADAAGAYADRVLRLGGVPRGPAYARNRGADVARGHILAFLDADVCVYPDALRRMLDVLDADRGVVAVFGAYDTAPSAPGLVSRYCNLVHHYVHGANAGDAETFWAGCGAIRRDVFRVAGGYDERRYPRPQIEDIELGYRIRGLGWRIVLRPEIQCTHLKRWTLRGMVVASVRDRGVPWVELLLSGRARAPTLNVAAVERLYTALAGVALAAGAVAAVVGDARWLLVAAGALAIILVGNRGLFGWLWRTGGAALALAAVPLRLLYYVLNGTSVFWGTVRYLRTARSDVPPPPGAPLSRQLPSRPFARAPTAARRTDLSSAASGDLERALVHAFAPMDKLAFGVAIGTAAGLLVWLVTAARLLLLGEGPTDLGLLSQFFAGYTESWRGAFVGLAWAFGVGFVAGWFAAFVRNLVFAVWLLVVRARAEFAATRDFLDHI